MALKFVEALPCIPEIKPTIRHPFFIYLNSQSIEMETPSSGTIHAPAKLIIGVSREVTVTPTTCKFFKLLDCIVDVGIPAEQRFHCFGAKFLIQDINGNLVKEF